MRRLCVLLLVLAPFAATACAYSSVAGRQLSLSRPPSDALAKVGVPYYLQVTEGGQPSTDPERNELVTAALRRALPTARSVTESSPPKTGRFLSLRLHEQGPGFLHLLWTIGSTAVGCVVPSASTTSYRLEADVYQDGFVVGEYRYEDEVRNRCLFLPYHLASRAGAERPAASPPNEVVSNIVNTFLVDFSRDFVEGGADVE